MTGKDDNESQRKLKNLLRNLFQFDASDLDFGIYRIMHHKKAEIEKFIENDLIREIEKQFSDFGNVVLNEKRSHLNAQIKKFREDFGENAVKDSGEVILSFRETPKGKELLAAKVELEAATLTQNNVNDVFNQIAEFFSRYYDRGDFISTRRDGGRNKYVVPYNGEEVMLHWANRDQYYVKTGEYFINYQFKVGSVTVQFKLKNADVETNNTKGKDRFFLLVEKDAIVEAEDRSLIIRFEYRPITDEEKKRFGNRNVQEIITNEILRRFSEENYGIKAELLRKNGDMPSLLEKHIIRYMTRNTSDYFIHKNLRDFLDRELEFFIKNEILDLDEMAGMDGTQLKLIMTRAKTIQGICRKIIDFITQIEDFQKKIFEKKKFVIRADYCVTLDKIPKEFYPEIVRNKYQLDEWKNLYAIGTTDASSKQKKILGGDKIDIDFLKSHKFLVLDTKFFDQEFKDRFLATFDNLDEAIGGLIIKSENWQALNLLREGYSKQFDHVFIDPPYNTGQDGFVYKDNYQHSSWLSMIRDRLSLCKELMTDAGIIAITIDYVEVSKLRLLCDDVFSPENFLADIAWEKRYTRSNNAKRFYSLKDTVICYRASEKMDIVREKRSEASKENYSNPDNDSRGDWISSSYVNPATKQKRPNLVYKIKNPVTGRNVEHPTHAWKYEWDTYQNHVAEKRLYWGIKGDYEYPRLKSFLSEAREGMVPVDVWNYEETGTTDDGGKEVNNLFGIGVFDNPKPPSLIKRTLQLMTPNGVSNRILDYYAGSGTTAQAVLELNLEDKGKRTYCLVEMGDYFETVIKPRICKLMYSRIWQGGHPQGTDGISHMFKYIYLEQYEDALNNIAFTSLDKTVQETLADFDDYFIRYMLDYETRESPARLITRQFENPFEYKLKIVSNGEEKLETVDLIETFNYLLGLHMNQLRVFEDDRRKYRVVSGKNDNGRVVVIWRNIKDIDYKRDAKFVNEKVIGNMKYDQIYVNGDSHIKGALPIEPEFKRRMGA